jgi:hypothetical protein
MPHVADRGGWRRLAVATAAVLALGASACGAKDTVQRADVQPGEAAERGSDAGTTTAGSSSAQVQLVRDATRTTEAVTSGRFELTMTGLDVPELGGQEAVVLRIDGAFDDGAGRSQVTMDLSGMASLAEQQELPTGPGDASEGMEAFADLMAGLFEPVTVVTDGATVYTRSSLFSGVLGVPTPWVSSPAEGSGSSTTMGFESFAVDDIGGFLGVLDAMGEVTEVGPEDVDGVGTTRYRVDVDPAEVDALRDDDFYGELADPAVFPGSLEVWIDGDGIIRRMVLDLDASSVTAGSGVPGTGQLRVELLVTEVGEPVDIVVPDPAEVTDLATWEPDLGALFGGEVPTTPTTGG